MSTSNSKLEYPDKVGIAYASKNRKVLRVALFDSNGNADINNTYFLYLWELDQYFEGFDEMRKTGQGKRSVSLYKQEPFNPTETNSQ